MGFKNSTSRFLINDLVIDCHIKMFIFKKNTQGYIFLKSTRFDGLPSNYIKNEQMLHREVVTHHVIEFYTLDILLSTELHV